MLCLPTRRGAPSRPGLSLGLLVTLAGCAGAPTVPTPPPAASAPSTPPEEDIAAARQAGKKLGFTWDEYGPAAFARAQREGKLVLLDCVATWCHWCHVMDDTTYTDPELGRLLRDKVVAVRVDIDSRPDLASRYEDYGWPATVLLSAGGEELGKFRGYLAPEVLRQRVEQALQRGAAPGSGAQAAPARRGLITPPVPVGMLGWIGAQATQLLDDYYDRDEGGWGKRQKMPLGANVEFELVRARHGDDAARERARFTLEKQRALIDPVWGGVYQYSVNGVWTEPHFEKRLPLQTAAIEAAARALTELPAPADRASARADGERVAGYVLSFLRNRDGLFLVSQDADLGGHDKERGFVDGHVYYAKDDAGRRALGIPRIDDHVYAFENGLAIAALSALAAALHGEPQAALYQKAAEQAADAILRSHVEPDGTVKREAIATSSLRFLADGAALALALARLGQQAGAMAGAIRYREAAERITATLWRTLYAPSSGLLWVSTNDPGAAGVFARREQPFAANVLVARALAALSRAAGVPEPSRRLYRQRALGLLAALATPERLSAQGRILGEYLLALDEAGALRWAR
ncbi:MAG: DUF255 domain-containing protein [Polyangia bacterium]